MTGSWVCEPLCAGLAWAELPPREGQLVACPGATLGPSRSAAVRTHAARRSVATARTALCPPTLRVAPAPGRGRPAW